MQVIVVVVGRGDVVATLFWLCQLYICTFCVHVAFGASDWVWWPVSELFGRDDGERGQESCLDGFC